jgi:hypothetical protein
MKGLAMNLNRKRVLAGVAATGIVAGALAGGGVALASTGSNPAPAATTASQPASGWCAGGLGYMGGMWSGQQPVQKAAADYLGLTQAQLQSQLQSGKSLADVATAQGKPVSGLTDAILTAMTNQINASTRLSAAQKTAMISQVKAHLDAMVNATHPYGTGMHRYGMDSAARDTGSPMGAMYGMR